MCIPRALRLGEILCALRKFLTKWVMLKIRLNILQQCLVLGSLHKTQHADLEMKEHLVPVT